MKQDIVNANVGDVFVVPEGAYPSDKNLALYCLSRNEDDIIQSIDLDLLLLEAGDEVTCAGCSKVSHLIKDIDWCEGTVTLDHSRTMTLNQFINIYEY